MITEDFCCYKVAELLAKKGFPMKDHLYMYVNKDNVFMTDKYACLKMPLKEYENFFDLYIPTITHQMAMKWLLQKYELFICIQQAFDLEGNVIYVPTVWKNAFYLERASSNKNAAYKTFEHAVDTSLFYCLTKLI